MTHRLLVLLLALASWADASSKTCKAFPGAADWPSTESWKDLNESLGGRLLRAAPPGAVCHPEQGAYDADRCAAVAAEWSDFDFHVKDPVSVMWNNWSNDSCLPDPAHMCRHDGYPAYVVNATTSKHVSLGIEFAQWNNVRLVVKSTGHDYLGRSIAPGSLSIWTHHMNRIQYHGPDFKLDGSNVPFPGNTVIVGGGSQMQNIYEETAKHNQTVVGGGCGTVGVSGFTTGGGHSLLAPRYGLAADNVVQMELVAPSGDILTLNEHQNTDLFWAVRGGGGSTYGVITSITFETHPSPAISHLTWAFVVEPGAPFLSDLFAYLLSQLPSLEAAGVSMYCTSQKAASTNPFPIAGLPSEVAGVMGIAVLQDNTDPEALATLWEPMSKAVSERWPSVTFASQSLEFASWVDWFGVTRDTRPVGGNNVMASRLLDETALSEDLDGLSGAIETAMSEAGRLTAFLVSGKAVHEADGNKGGNAVHPSWRRAYVHAITSSSFPSFNATAKSAAIERVDAAVEGLRRLAPDMGSYLNEGSRYEKDWQEAFWGANYPRLLEIKRAVDPNNVFWCEPCVGSEGWMEYDDGKLCRT